MVKVTPAILDRLHGPGRTAAIQSEARRHVRGGVPQSPEKFKGGESVKPKRRFPAPSRLYKVQETLRLSVLHQDVREIIVPEVVPSHADAAMGVEGIQDALLVIRTVHPPVHNDTIQVVVVNLTA